MKDLKETFEAMEINNCFDYGVVIPQSEIHSIFDIKMPAQGSFKDYQDAMLKELSCIGYIREKLIKQGRYIKKDGVDYRVLLASENSKQADTMLDQAKRKTRRAANLLKSTPRENRENDSGAVHNLELSLDRIAKHNLLVA